MVILCSVYLRIHLVFVFFVGAVFLWKSSVGLLFFCFVCALNSYIFSYPYAYTCLGSAFYCVRLERTHAAIGLDWTFILAWHSATKSGANIRIL